MQDKIIRLLALVAFLHIIYDVATYSNRKINQKIRIENPIYEMDDLDYGIGLYHDSITVVDSYGLDTTVYYTEDLGELFMNLNL